MKKLILICSLLFAYFTTKATDVIVLQGVEKNIPIGPHLSYLEDKSDSFSIQSFLDSSIKTKFQKHKNNVPRLGLSSSSFWFHFSVQNSGKSDQEYVLLIDDPSLYQVDLYVVENEKIIAEKFSGIALKSSQRDIKGNKIAFRLRLLAGKKLDIYFKVRSKNYISIPAHLLSNSTFYERMGWERSILGVYYGIILSINILCFLFLVSIRNSTYLYLIIYASLAGITTGSFDGFSPEFLHFMVTWTNGYQDIPLSIFSMLAGLVFIQKFLKMREYFKVLNRFSNAYLILMVLGLVAFLIFPKFGYPIATSLALGYVIIVMGISIVGLRQGIREAYFVLAAFNVVTLAIIVVILSLYQILPLSFFTLYSLHFAYIIQLSILFLGVFNYILNIRQEISNQILAKEQEKTHELEEKVLHRTKELSTHQARLKSLIENTTDVVWSVDMDYCFLTLNTAAKTFFEKEMGKVVQVGDCFFDIFTDDQGAQWKKHYAKAFTNDHYNFEGSRKRTDKDFIYCEFFINTIRENGEGVQGFSVFKRDITERRIKEMMILESESKLNAIINNNHDAIWLVAPDYQIIHFNTAFIRMCQSVFRKDPKNHQSFLDLLPNQENTLTWKQRLDKSFSGQQSTFMDVYKVGWDKSYYDIMTYPIFQNEQITGVTVIARNVTDKENAQIELRKSEERYNLAVSGSQEGIWDWDLENNQAYLSRRWKAMLGYKNDEIVDQYETFTQLLHPDDLPKVTRALQRYFDKESDKYELEVRLKHKDGSWRWIKTSGVALWDNQGRAYRMAGSHIDVTQRKEDELNLRNKEAGLRAILDHHDDGVFLLNENLELIDFNIVYEHHIRKYYNYKIKIGLPIHQLVEVMGVEPVWIDRFKQALKGEGQMHIHTFELPQKYFVFETKIYPIYERGQIRGISVFSKEITEAKKSEERLERAVRRSERQARLLKKKERLLYESELMLQTVISKLPQSIYWKDRNLVYLGCNIVFAQQVKMSDPTEIIGKSDQGIPWTVSQRRAFHSDDKLVMENNLSTLDEEQSTVDEFGDEQWFSISKIPLKDLDGEIFGVLGIIVDITERKKQSQILQKAKDTAEDAARSKAFFLSTMTHEIRNPLNAVIGITHLLKSENPKKSQIEYLNTLEFSAGQLMTLINDILDFNKIEAQKIVLEQITFSLHKFLQKIQNSFEPRVKEKGILLKIMRDDNLPEQVVGDQARLSQILNNLLSNAIKFTKKGSVCLRVSFLGATSEHTELRFEVTDTGIGIPKDKLEEIFDNFSQASTDTTRKYGGTGLGLSITKKLLELHKSEIVVESKLGAGSTFRFDLKLPKAQESDSTEAQDSTEPQKIKNTLDGLKILLAEDHPINQMVATKFLQNWGIIVDFADNGKLAIDKLSQCSSNNCYNIVLMDLQMPELNGYETAKQIRSSPIEHLQNIPIIALTASPIDEVKDDIFASGMNDYVSKPFNPNELYKKIARYSQKKIITKLPTETKKNMNENGVLNIDNIKALVGNDVEYRKELIELYIDFLENFPKEYKEILKLSDLNRLEYFSHKSKPSIEFLELKNIEKEINYVRLLLENQENNQEYFQSSIERVEKECVHLIGILMDFSNLESV